MKVEAVAIIGAGPAGLTCAMQLQRYGIKARIFESRRIGGLLWNANLVENYPGFPGGITGPALVNLFETQTDQLGVEITYQTVRSLKHAGDHFLLQTGDQILRAKIVVLACGTRPKRFPARLVSEAVSPLVCYEIADLLDQREKRFAIVGAGDAAFDYALNLGHENKVLILNRGDQLDCLPLLWERASQLGNIQYHALTHLEKLSLSEEGALCLECMNPKGRLAIEVDFLVGAIGRQPHMDFISPDILAKVSNLEAAGCLYLIGDVKNGIYRQTAIAVGDGLKAAMKIYKYLKEKEV